MTSNETQKNALSLIAHQATKLAEIASVARNDPMIDAETAALLARSALVLIACFETLRDSGVPLHSPSNATHYRWAQSAARGDITHADLFSALSVPASQ